jgi:hypothetical protein
MNENNGGDKGGLFLVMGIKRLFSRFIGLSAAKGGRRLERRPGGLW